MAITKKAEMNIEFIVKLVIAIILIATLLFFVWKKIGGRFGI